MIQNRNQYHAARKSLRELRVECRLVERKLRITPWKESLLQKLEQLQATIFQLKSETDLFLDIEGGVIEVDLSSIPRIAELLIMARIRSGLTQKQFAALVGINRQQFTRYEQSLYKNASLKQIVKIAEKLEAIKRPSRLGRNSAKNGRLMCPSNGAPDVVPLPHAAASANCVDGNTPWAEFT